MLSRRQMFLTPAVLFAPCAADTAPGKMTLALHQNTSARAGFRPSLEGWAKAGITQVEINNGLLDEFLKTDSLAAARRVFTDLGLTPVSGACGVTGLIDPNPTRAASLDHFKARCEMWATLGIRHIYSTTASTVTPTAEVYQAAAENVRDVGEVARQFPVTAMFEFVRTSSFASTLTTLLSIMRAAAQPNVGVLFDCYHFWSGLNKLEDLDTIRPGEIAHVHFQDVPDMPREMLDTTTRVIPGDGVTPLTAILHKLSAAGYAGPLSVELFLPKFQQGDPFEVAREITAKSEAVMRRAAVL